MLDIRMGENGEVVFEGRFDASQEQKAQSFLDTVAEPRVFDFRGLEYISSAGLGVLIRIHKRSMASGQGLRLINVNKHIWDIFRYSGFDQVFDIQQLPK